MVCQIQITPVRYTSCLAGTMQTSGGRDSLSVRVHRLHTRVITSCGGGIDFTRVIGGLSSEVIFPACSLAESQLHEVTSSAFVWPVSMALSVAGRMPAFSASAAWDNPWASRISLTRNRIGVIAVVAMYVCYGIA